MKENKKYFLISIIVVFIIKLITSYSFYQYLDLITANFSWTQQIAEKGLFNMYMPENGVFQIDYPPLFLYLIYPIHKIVIFTYEHSLNGLFQLLMKSIPLVFDLIITFFLYKKFNLKAAFLWSINTAIFVNVALWGQMDIPFIALMLFMIFYMEKDKPNQVLIFFALSCLLKPQGVYLFPIVILYLINSKRKKCEKRIAFSIGLLTGIIGWLPFMISNKNIILPIIIYLGSIFRYSFINLNAGNFYFLFNGVEYSGTIGLINFAMLIISIILLFNIFKKTNNYYLASAVYMFNIFMFTFGQHERYGIYAMFLFFLYFILTNNKNTKIIYILITIATTINQIGVLIKENEYYKKIFEGILPQDIVRSEFAININNVSVIIAALLNIFASIILLKELVKITKESKKENING